MARRDLPGAQQFGAGGDSADALVWCAVVLFDRRFDVYLPFSSAETPAPTFNFERSRR